ncbi:hypothetical protein NOF55_16500 [Rhizobiaceae bacterium BDR2-2]|uniref:Uncharacterized protein n=1 Tax=Ectorhizobium quercum TaxID=2965071 RepID=A0AAE3MXF4_9HYPH|nr:hypothetical protein [Ectorhizobium quercum]MCX8996246.1 hypothetical protein [Ectorhizobium quercum]MCX8998715.1 hypothetical protein [Ectorhizobium quercum]
MSEESRLRRWLIIALMGAFILPLGATLIMASYKLVTTAGPMIWGSWSNHSSRLQREEDRVARIEQDARERSFQIVCPDYFDASILDRWTGYRNLSWCEDYRDRMPETD